jgi:hypothetical protein
MEILISLSFIIFPFIDILFYLAVQSSKKLFINRFINSFTDWSAENANFFNLFLLHILQQLLPLLILL